MYYNPAASANSRDKMSRPARSLSHIYADYVSPSVRKNQKHHQNNPCPQLGYTLSLKDMPLSFGPPWAFMLPSVGDGVAGQCSVSQCSLGSQANLYHVNPVAAWRPHPTLSIAIAPPLIIQRPSYGRRSGPPYQFQFKEMIWPSDSMPHSMRNRIRCVIRAKYFSAPRLTTMDRSFNPQHHFCRRPWHTKTHLDFPQMVAAGISFRPTNPTGTFEVDIDWTDWGPSEEPRSSITSARSL